MHSLAALTRKLSAFAAVEPDLRLFSSLLPRPQVVAARQVLPLETEPRHRRAFLIEEGWALSYKVLPDGSRQVIDVAVAGDILGMRSLLLRSCDVDAVAVTPAVVVEISGEVLRRTIDLAPRLGAALLWAVSRDEGLVVERLVDIGRRSAAERVAHFMLELNQRLRLVGLADGDSFRCPLSQAVIADALGLTPIHLNRTLRELRSQGLFVCSQGQASIGDRARLADLAGFDPLYLDERSDA